MEELADFAKKLEWKAASISDVRKAPCTKDEPFTVSEISSWLKAKQSKPNQNRNIHGIKFENESQENLETFEFLTTARTYWGEIDSKNQKTFKSSCKKVECAVKEIFGPKIGIQLLFMHRKFGMNGSHLSKSNRSSWKSTELDTVLLALSDMPEGILPAETNRPLTHFKRGYLPGHADERTIANATIEVFDLWSEITPAEQRYSILHELGHNLGGLAGDADNHSKWFKMSGWESETKVVNGKIVTEYKATRPQTIISRYGLTNPAEDFAESVSAYRYNANKLKSVSPEKYNFIKEVIFDNVEYTSEQACKNPKRLSDEFAKKALGGINNWRPTSQEIEKIATQCSSLAITELSQKGTVNVNSTSMKQCYERAFYIHAALKDNPNSQFLGPVLKNAKISPLTAKQLTELVNSAAPVHRNLLRSYLNQGLKGQYRFGPHSKKEDLKYIYQHIPVKIGFDPFYKISEFQNIATSAAHGISNNGSLRRWVGMDFSDTEITDQVNLMIK